MQGFEILVFSESHLPRGLARATFQDRRAQEDLWQKLREALDRPETGGLIAVVDRQRAAFRVRVESVGPAGPTRKRALELRLGYPPHWREEAELGDIAPSTHLILPVDAEAARQVEGLLENLEVWPADFEALVLNSLASPGLEERLRRLEGKAAREPGTGSRWQRRGRLGWLWRLVHRLRHTLVQPLPAWLFLLVVLAAAQLAYRPVSWSLLGWVGSEDATDTADVSSDDGDAGNIQDGGDTVGEDASKGENGSGEADGSQEPDAATVPGDPEDGG